jgi:tRNA pseudouridine38-40 synthase
LGERRVALIVSYAGGAWHGFQRQPTSASVQGELEKALATLCGPPVPVRGAGRTDAGVHAAGQVADFLLPASCRIPTPRLPRAIASHLSRDIVPWSAHDVAADFHSRKHALGKRYRYLIWRAGPVPPFLSPYCLPYQGALDVAAMAAAARLLVGRHDFSAFAGSARPVTDAVRTVVDCRLRVGPRALAVEVEADGFLYRMVRAIAGTLLEVGRGAMAPLAVASLLAGGRRGDAGASLPPQGLCLLWVRYPGQAGVPAPDDGSAWPPAPGDALLAPFPTT